jgi:hypothetical protein
VLIGLGALGLVLALVVGGGLWFLTNRYAGNVERVADVFTGIEAQTRPTPATPEEEVAGEPVTFLLVGSDTRSELAPGGDARWPLRRDHARPLSADGQHAQLISIPRES